MSDDDYLTDIERIQSIGQVPLILDVCSRTTGMGFTAIARVTEDRWITCASKDELDFGLMPGDELRVETTICNEIRASSELVVFDDAQNHPTFCNHPTPSMYGFRSYISVPIRLPNGEFFGTLCAIDPEPRQLSTPQVVGLFEICADLIGISIDTATRLNRSETDLGSEREIATLREEFIAVVSHDLRNPIAALSAGLRIVTRGGGSETGRVLQEMQSVVMRMSSLVDNLMDFASGRLGGKMRLDKQRVNLRDVIGAVVSELELASGRSIEVELDLPEVVQGDATRISQLLANLLTNAVSHGDPTKPIAVRGKAEGDTLRIDVISGGAPIPAEQRDRMFNPYVRGPDAGTKGLGLGLYIASQIARAHGGRLTVASESDGNRFSFHMPCRREP